MAEPYREAPRDRLTGLPLLINYRPGEFPESAPLPERRENDEHHGYFDAATFGETTRDKITRESWGSTKVPRFAHDWYHEHALPTEPYNDMFKWMWSLIAAAGEYMPPEVVSLPRKGEFKVERVSPDRRYWLRGSYGDHMPNSGKVRHTILRWVMDNASPISNDQAELFVATDCNVILAIEGRDIIREACNEATGQFQELYGIAHSRGRFPRRMPPDVREGVFKILTEVEPGKTDMHAIGWLRHMLKDGLPKAAPDDEQLVA